jgi:regulator of chromosome condensation
MAKRPIEIPLPEKIVKLASGNDFVLFLSETGQVYSCGNGETGQLGRLNRYACEDGRRGGIGKILFELINYKKVKFFFRTINYTNTYSL